MATLITFLCLLVFFLVLIMFFVKYLNESKIAGKLYVYQDECGEIQLYLEAAITPLEISKHKTVTFEVDLLDTRK